MTPLGGLVLCVGVSRLAAAIAYPILARGPRARQVALVLLAPLILGSPLVIPLEGPFGAPLRWVAAIDGAALLFKLWDLHLGHPIHGRPPLRAYVEHVAAMVWWDFSYRRRGTNPTPPELGRRALYEAIGLVVGLVGLVLTFGLLDLGRVHFLLDHGAKAVAVYLFVAGSMNVAAALRARATGLPTLLPFDGPLRAATPADFWRRWNRSISQYLYEAVYKPVGGRRHPARGVAAAFLVSALLHEYLYAVALAQVQGYQLAFFGLNGVAVLVSGRAKPRGAARHLWRVGTVAFLLLSSTLFFASNAHLFAGLFQWYPHGGWLP